MICEEFINCSKLKKTVRNSWKLNPETNICEEVKQVMKFHIGLAAIMITGMLGGFLFLVLDDKYFCIKSLDTAAPDSSRVP